MATRPLSARKVEAIRFLWRGLLDSGLPIMSVPVLEKLSIEDIHTLSFQFVGDFLRLYLGSPKSKRKAA